MKTHQKLLLALFFILTAVLLLAVSASAKSFASDEAALANSTPYPVRTTAEGGNGYYRTLDSAMTAVKAGGTITVFGEVEVSATITITKNDITFTGTGTVVASTRIFTINASAVKKVTFSGNLTLRTTDNSILRVLSTTSEITVTVDGATLIASNNTPLWLGASTSNTLLMNGGELRGEGYYGVFFSISGSNTMQMTGGRVYGKSAALHLDYAADLYLNGGTLASNGSIVRVMDESESAVANDKTSHIYFAGADATAGTYIVYTNAKVAIEHTAGLLTSQSSTFYLGNKELVSGSSLTVNGKNAAVFSYKNLIDVEGPGFTFTMLDGNYQNDGNTSGIYTGTAATGFVANIAGGQLHTGGALFTCRNAITVNVTGGLLHAIGEILYGYANDIVFNVYGGELFSDGSDVLRLYKNNGTINLYGGLITCTRERSTASGIVIYEGATYCTVNVQGGMVYAAGTGSPFVNNANTTCKFNLVNGYCTVGGAAVLTDAAKSSNNVAYASSTGIYRKNAFYMTNGAQVRLVTDSNGIRFVSTLDKNSLAYLNERGAQDISFGTIILPYDTAAQLDFVSPEQIRHGGVQYIELPAVYGTSYSASSGYKVRAALTNLKEYNILRSFTAVSYVTYTVNGITHTQCSLWTEGRNIRTIGEVARAALADTTQSYTVAEEAVLNNYAAYQSVTIAGNALSQYEILIPNKNVYTEYYLALMLSDTLAARTGVTLPIVTKKTSGKKQIAVGSSLCSAAVPNTADGYAIAVNGSTLEVNAGNYLGYAAAYSRLVGDIFGVSRRTVSLPTHYTASGRNNSAEAAIARDHSGLRIMVNNIWNGTKYEGDTSYNLVQRMDIAFSIYNAYRPDVLGLQEYHDNQRQYLHSRLLGIGYTEVPVQSTSTNATNATPIYYNSNTVELLTYGYYWYGNINFAHSAYKNIIGTYNATTVKNRIVNGDGHGEKGFTWAIFREKVSGSVFLAASTHHWWKSEVDEDTIAREVSVAYLKETLLAKSNEWLAANKPSAAPGSMPIFAGGDMNTNASRPPYQRFITQTPTQSGSTTDNVFIDVNSLATGERITFNTHHGYANYDATKGIYTNPKFSHAGYSGTIDYIFTNRSAQDVERYSVVRTACVDDRYGYLFTDHSPIFTDIAFPLPDTDTLVSDIWD